MRKPFDEAVTTAQMGQLSIAAELIHNKVKDMPASEMDGCLNYVFTQMLRKVENLTDAKIVIDLVINTLFWMEPKYIKFERIHGLLYCMIDEFKRRSWRRNYRVVRILEHLLEINRYKRDEYEDEKIAQNGDLK